MKSWLCFLVSVTMFAQSQRREPPLPIDVLTEGLGNPDLIMVPDLTREVRLRGIDFDLDDQHLAALFAAGAKGQRNPTEVVGLVQACLSACQMCRMRSVAPLTQEELVSLFSWRFTPEAIIQQVRIRGVQGIEMTRQSIDKLRSLGVDEGLIPLLIPDDKIPTPPRTGYQSLELKHSEEYDPSAAKGWMKIEAELPANSQSEFVFVHTGLFVKALKGDPATAIAAAYFNKPTPRNIAEKFIDYSFKIEDVELSADEKKSGRALSIPRGKPKGGPGLAVDLRCTEPESDGNNAFVFSLGNGGNNARDFSLMLRWEISVNPKTVRSPNPAAKKK